MKKIVLLLMICTLFLCGCQSTDETKDLYISFTVKRVNETDESLTMTNYVYDVKEGSITEKVELPYTAQYPLTVYDHKNDCVYYTHREHGSDHIYKKSLSDHKVEQLTDDLFAVNELIPTKDQLYIAAVTKDNPSLNLFSYKDHTLTRATKDPDLNVCGLTWNPSTETLIFSTFSESYRNEQRELGTNIEEPRTIYTMRLQQDQEPQQYAKTEFSNIKSLWINESNQVYAKLEYIYKIQPDGTSEQVEELQKLDVDSFLYMDDHVAYYISGDDLISYDFDTKTKTYVYEADSKYTTIHNAIMLSY